MEKALRDAGVVIRGCILNKTTQILEYADDITIMSRTTYSLKEMFNVTKRNAVMMGLVINKTKIKFIRRISAKYNHVVGRQDLSINNHVVEHVKEFVYLELLMRDDDDTTCEIRRRIVLASRTYYGLRTQLTSQ